ncbi:ABC transporter ATP-binding protein [Niveibacterium microcysteis]|uniref:ABC transporter ATP-binding protein n=2 Tax=Niveibacterium microcysteis TaxID=2811415 RepID=A0ABX7MCF9_9RHOO|nr:ABC transporter ATP-binding protein [Niveibacterium microcysteis]QSI78903.1 ABC transporter ATP-binding protein [Niveibacterium microcysteis]
MERNMNPNTSLVLEAVDLLKRVDGVDGELTILQQISFSVGAGETVAVVGESGSGKSTLLGLLAGLDVPSSGTVKLRGTDLFLLNEDDRARMRGEALGFVFQSFQLLPALTALENVMMPLELAGRRDPTPVANRWLDRVGLSHRVGHYPKHLSGGEQQRVALARAFAVQPAVLLADEPTGNLDAATGLQIADLMFDMNREAGTTLVLVTHDERLAARCSRVIRLAAGQLLSDTLAAAA